VCKVTWVCKLVSVHCTGLDKDWDILDQFLRSGWIKILAFEVKSEIKDFDVFLRVMTTVKEMRFHCQWHPKHISLAANFVAKLIFVSSIHSIYFFNHTSMSVIHLSYHLGR
jgi:hypothetical protein